VPSKAELLRRTRQEIECSQDSDAASRFTDFYRQHVAFVWRTVRFLGAPPENIDDAVQDVFLVAHRRLVDFEARSSPRTWLFAISLRVVSDHRRSRKRQLRLLTQARTIQPEPSASPLDDTLNAETRDSLLSAIESLSDEQRVVFVMTEIEDMTAPEIASALQVKLNTVYSRLRAARRELTGMLKESVCAPRS
jgi:RNA polymerase sigma-70 factor (ECF subfamily)